VLIPSVLKVLVPPQGTFRLAVEDARVQPHPLARAEVSSVRD